MRKGLVGFMVLVVLVGLSSSIYAGGIINKQNLSADYIRTLNRNAATDMADAAAFNPAGTAMMQNGLYVKADAIYLMKDYSNQTAIRRLQSFNLGTLDSEEPSIIPGCLRCTSRTAGPAFSPSRSQAAAERCDYKDGDARRLLPLGVGLYRAFGAAPTRPDQYIEAESHYIGYSLGAAYKIFDSLSLSGGCTLCRCLSEIQRLRREPAGLSGNTVNVKIERDGSKPGIIFSGLDYAPTKDLNIALTYMSNTPLNFKADTRDNYHSPRSPTPSLRASAGQDGTHEREDLPGYIAAGVSYFILPGTLRIEPNFTYYFEKQAKLEGQRFQNSSPATAMTSELRWSTF